MINRTIKPEPSEEITFHLPKFEKFNLKNGLTVYFIKRNQLPILGFNMVLNAGSKYDPAGKKGMVNLFSLVIDEGAGDFDALQLNDEFDILGSNFDISTNNDNIFLSLRTLKENKERSLELFSAVIKRPHFKEEAFAREQRKVLTRILQLKDDPEELANIVFENQLFGKENPYAYPVIGMEEDVKNITSEDLKHFYSNYFTPMRTTIIVTGDSEREEVEQLLNKYLGDWNTKGISTNAEISNRENEGNIYFIHKEGAVQAEIRLGHISSGRNSEDYFSKMILNNVLGGQFTSRINLNLRENKGYTYGAFSRFNYYKDAGYFYISTSVNAENTGNALREIFKELNGIKEGAATEELDFAKSSLIRKFPSNFETNRHIASNISALVIHSLPDDYFDTYLDNIKQITISDVNRSAMNSIHPEKSLVVIAGDKNVIISQLGEFGRKIIEIDNPAA